MSPFWAVPLCVLAIGAVVVALVARSLAAQVTALRPEVTGLVKLLDEARHLHHDIDAARRRGVALAIPARVLRRRWTASDPKAAGIDR